MNNGEPTRGKNVIDLTISTADLLGKISNWKTINPPTQTFTDHKMIKFKLNLEQNNQVSSSVKWNLTDETNWSNYQEKVEKLLKNFDYNTGIREQAISTIMIIFTAALETIGLIEVFHFPQPWWNHNLERKKKAMKRIKRAISKLKAWTKQKRLRNLKQLTRK